MRRGRLAESAALAFKRLDKAGREIRKAAAAAVTERPAGSMISVRMKSPGCGGVFVALGVVPLLVMGVFLNSDRKFRIPGGGWGKHGPDLGLVHGPRGLFCGHYWGLDSRWAA